MRTRGGHFISVTTTDVATSSANTHPAGANQAAFGYQVINGGRDELSAPVTHDYTCLAPCARDVFTSQGAET